MSTSDRSRTADLRRLAAKRYNERVKLLATTMNTIGLGILAAATIIPIFGQAPSAAPWAPWWTGPLAFVILWSIAFAILGFLKSEDR